MSLTFLALSCGDSGPSEADLKAEAEAEQIELLSVELEEQIDELGSSRRELETALDSLDALFPELEQ
ncbi:hypothetical protein CEQ90_08270 [Lewinellaceae bacterium SD302]|nr:hypothetical protein CEQ90_08270 [Lewinellaceae bacterium SD302]